MNPIWKVTWIQPAVMPQFGSESHVDALIFKLEHDGTYLPVPEWDNNQYRYRCMNCFAACGSDRYTFSTGYERAKHLKDGPTQQQQDEMSDHARQHEIMFVWARSVK